MPKGHASKREKKKPKAKSEKSIISDSNLLPNPEVEIIKKKRKYRGEDN